jgi:hypothetical protein
LEASSVLSLKITRMNISSRTVESVHIHYVEVDCDRQAIELGIYCETTHQRVDVALLKRLLIASARNTWQCAPLS